MADEQFQQASGNWWESARNMTRFESGTSVQSSSSGIGGGGHEYGWPPPPQDLEDMKPTRSSMDSSSCTSSVVFHDKQLHPPPDSHTFLGLSSQAMDWNQASLLRGEKGGENCSLRSMLQENLSSTRNNFQQQVEWKSEKLLFSSDSTTSNEFKEVNNNNNRGFSLDQNHFSPQYSSGDSTTITSQGMPSTFQIDSSIPLYGSSGSSILQGLLGPNCNNQNQQISVFPNYQTTTNYGLNSNTNHHELVPNPWSNKVPQFLRTSPPKQQPLNNQLHFANNAPFWNASDHQAPPIIKDVRSSFFPSLQPSFDHVQPKNISEGRNSGGVVKKSGGEPAAKRQRNETPSPLPAFKVRKEKMGDRITALQQLVSPFGKTDTASVLSEAIEYIKFLHEQVTVLSTPYMKSGAPPQIQQSSGKSKEGDGPKQDLRSRGLCLVPVSSTFPVTHETTVDFWTPTFGGTSR